MDYKYYQQVRNASWQILIDCGIDALPVSICFVCKQLGVRVYTYGAAAKLLKRYGLADLAKQTDGLSFYAGATPVILYDGTLLATRARFTAAHELGHIVLRHIAPGQVTARNREPVPGDDPEETAANQFAARLLAPACVLYGLGIKTPEEIAGLCGISRQAAGFRAQRMNELYQKDKFLSHPLERKLYEQFKPFIARQILPPGDQQGRSLEF